MTKKDKIMWVVLVLIILSLMAVNITIINNMIEKYPENQLGAVAYMLIMDTTAFLIIHNILFPKPRVKGK